MTATHFIPPFLWSVDRQSDFAFGQCRKRGVQILKLAGQLLALDAKPGRKDRAAGGGQCTLIGRFPLQR